MNPRVKSIARRMLLAAIVAAAGFLAWWTWRTTVTLERLGQRSVIETTGLLVREKLDRVEQQIVDADNAVVHFIDPDDLDPLVDGFAALATRVAPTALSVLVLDEAERPLRAVSRVSPEDAARTRDLVERLRPELRLATLQGEDHRHWHGTIDGRTVLLSCLARATAGRRYFVVIETDLDHVKRALFPTIFDDAAAAHRMTVTDDQGRIVYGRSLATVRGFLVSHRFSSTLYKWRITAVPREAPQLEAGARSRRILEGGYVVLSLAVIIVGIVFFAFAAREEERLNQLKSDFIATVSHELKTPLSLIRMFGEMLATDRVPSAEKRTQYLEIIVRESERLTALIENVLDFARLERGRIAYQFEDADLGNVVFRGVEMFRYRLVADKPKLVTDIAPSDSLPRARLDERALHLLLFNLIDNAVKYASDSDEVIVRVHGDAHGLTLEVEDHGPGIDPDEARRVFERFYRGSNARSGGARGSGIGLALVKHIAQAHGGDVSVHPVTPRGTLFRVRIPIRAEAVT